MTDSQNLKIKLLKQNKKNIGSILKIDQNACNEVSFNVWSSSPYLRFGKVFGLFFKNSLKGFAIYIKSWDDPQLAYLIEIAIQKEHQRNGFGSHLLSNSFLILKKEGITSIVLHVDPNNEPALHFYYDKFSFKFVEFRKNEFGEGRDRLFLKLDL